MPTINQSKIIPFIPGGAGLLLVSLRQRINPRRTAVASTSEKKAPIFDM